MGRLPTLFLITFLGCLWLSHCQSSDNWLPTIFGGQNQPPPGNTTVWMDAYLWRLNSVDEINYHFVAHLRYTLTWRDTRAEQLIINATERQQELGEPCRRPCDNANFPSGNPSVQLPQLDTSARCCDDIYLPTLLTDSVLDFPGGNFYYRILTHPGGYVSWSVKVLATYYTSLSFRAFPFDKQLLTVLFRVPEFQEYADGRVRFVPSVAAISNRFQQGLEHGDELSNYYIDSIWFDVFEEPWTDVYRDVYVSVDKRLNDTPSGDIVAQRITANYTSISVVIQINRYSAFYVWTVILPISLVGYLGFAIFFFQPSEVVTRFQSIITLFLALMALQYVINASLPASSYTLPSQQFIVATYILYLFLTLETFFVYMYDRAKQRSDERSMQQRNPRHPSGIMKPQGSTQPSGDTASPTSVVSTGSTVRGGWATLRAPGGLSTAMGRDATGSEAMASPWEEACPGSDSRGSSAAAETTDVEGGRVLWRLRSRAHEHVYHWRARRVDKTAGALMLVLYTVAAVLLFLLPVALH